MSSAFHDSRGDNGINDGFGDEVNAADNYDTASIELDPLTSPEWFAEDDEVLAIAPPLEEFEALYEDVQPGGTEPVIVPGIDEIISGEYTGWVPIIGPDTLPDGSSRADQYRVTENVDPIKDAIAKGLEPSAVTGAFQPRKSAPVTRFDDFVEDPDQLVVSPAQALEEARRRIELMRASLKVNVTEVAANLTGDFVPTYLTNTNVEADPGRINNVVESIDEPVETDISIPTMRRDISQSSQVPPQRIHPIPVPQPPSNPIVEKIVGAEPVFDQNEPMLGVDDVYSTIIFERIAALRIAREQLEAEEQAAASMTHPVPDSDEFDTVIIKLPTAINPERDDPDAIQESPASFVEDTYDSAVVQTPVVDSGDEPETEIETELAAEVSAPQDAVRENAIESIASAMVDSVIESPNSAPAPTPIVTRESAEEIKPEVDAELLYDLSDSHPTGAFLREILDEIAKEPVPVEVETPVVAVVSEPIAVHESFEDLFGDESAEEPTGFAASKGFIADANEPTPIFEAVTEIVNLNASAPKHAAPAAEPVAEVAQEIQAEQVAEPTFTESEPMTDSHQDVATQEPSRVYAQSTQKPTIIMHEEQQSASQLELVIMRDEIQDLRNRLDANQKLVEDLMVRLSDLAMAALSRRD